MVRHHHSTGRGPSEQWRRWRASSLLRIELRRGTRFQRAVDERLNAAGAQPI